MIVAIAAIPRHEADAMVRIGRVHVPGFDETWLVSISSPNGRPLAVFCHPFVLRVVFQDWDPDRWPNILLAGQHPRGFVTPPDREHECLTPDQAARIVEHVSHAHARPGRVFLLAHCDGGVSRSGAVALWAAGYAGVDEGSVRAAQLEGAPAEQVRLASAARGVRGDHDVSWHGEPVCDVCHGPTIPGRSVMVYLRTQEGHMAGGTYADCCSVACAGQHLARLQRGVHGQTVPAYPEGFELPTAVARLRVALATDEEEPHVNPA